MLHHSDGDASFELKQVKIKNRQLEEASKGYKLVVKFSHSEESKESRRM